MCVMSQMNKGGKFVFGISTIRENGIVQIPTQAMQELDITRNNKVYLFTGSKITDGFCVTRKGLLEPSKLGDILLDNHDFLNSLGYLTALSKNNQVLAFSNKEVMKN